MRSFHNVICTGCSLLCDDIQVTVEGSHIKEILNACSKGCSRFVSDPKEGRLLSPLIKRNGRAEKASLEDAVKETVEILKTSDRPLLYGWSNCVSEAQILGIKIARKIRGAIDATSSFCQGVVYLAACEAKGYHTVSLGEVFNRADLLVFWGCNPADAHLRHFSRYTFFPRGRYRQTGFEERDSILIDVRESGSAKIARTPLIIEPETDYELIQTIRAIIKGHEIQHGKVSGVGFEKVKSIADKMVNSRFCVIFYGLGLSGTKGTYRNVSALLSLVDDINRRGTRCAVIPMAGHFNMVGFNRVLLELTGYPYGVDFHDGSAYWNPGETTAFDLLKKEEVDALVVVGADPVSHFPRKIAKYISEIPTIYIGPHVTPTSAVSRVSIPATIAGIEQEGVAYRLDGLPLKLKKIADPPDGVIPDVAILEAILKRL
ncbi:MAG: formylmethanofuran dehydrogenase subunit B [Candidatus Baldrarchaeia archaeon]